MTITELCSQPGAAVAGYLFFIVRARPRQERTHVYIGRRDAEGRVDSVRRDGQALAVCLDEVNHSPTGFEWGFHGSGPAQLAYGLLRAEVGPALAQYLYMTFKTNVVAAMPPAGGFRLTSRDILAWIWGHAEWLAAHG